MFENIFYYYIPNLFQIFEHNNETMNNICKSSTQKVNKYNCTTILANTFQIYTNESTGIKWQELFGLE